MLILPAIDLIDKKCVRLTQGDYNRRTDYGLDPIEVAKQFADEGAEWLHVVDLDGAKAGQPINLDVIEAITSQGILKVEMGGGIRDDESVRNALEAGVSRVVIGTALIRDPDWAASLFSSLGERIVAGIDTRDGKVAVHGWLETGETDGTELARKFVQIGCRRIITTDIATDGAFTGPNMEMLRGMVEATGIPVIASGGVASLDDLRLIRDDLPQIEGVIVGKALYEGRFTVAQAVEVFNGS